MEHIESELTKARGKFDTTGVLHPDTMWCTLIEGGDHGDEGKPFCIQLHAWMQSWVETGDSVSCGIGA